MSLKEVVLENDNPGLRIIKRSAPLLEEYRSEEEGKVDLIGNDSLTRKQSEHIEKGPYFGCNYRTDRLTVFVIGASGDLAKKKTYPSLLALYVSHYLPEHFHIVGYARSSRTDDEFRKQMRAHLLSRFDDENAVDSFLSHCYYRYGSSYDDEDAVRKTVRDVEKWEKECKACPNRLFYFAIPPTVFVDIAKVLKKVATGQKGWSRFIVEKPFGHDSESFEKLHRDFSNILSEDEIFRIDHYIGKEAVQNLLVMRFANATFEPLWNRNYISTVTISFKEDFGTKGRGGYFDKEGIIRDVMQNHCMQVLTMFAMEAPVHYEGDYVRDEKVKVLKSMPPISIDSCVTGQYVADDEGREESYTSHEGVPDDSKTPTFAAFVLYINNPRWEGVPFIMRAGKALNERKTEVRVQFKQAPGSSLLFPGVGEDKRGLERNEVVIRVQPNEAVYMKLNIKEPGLAGDPMLAELDLSYRTRFPDKFSKLPDAYTRLILQVLRGESSTFVRDDELREAWRIFTPMLHAIDEGKIQPFKYKAFSRGPVEFDDLTLKMGYQYAGTAYQWKRREEVKNKL